MPDMPKADRGAEVVMPHRPLTGAGRLGGPSRVRLFIDPRLAIAPGDLVFATKKARGVRIGRVFLGVAIAGYPPGPERTIDVRSRGVFSFKCSPEHEFRHGEPVQAAAGRSNAVSPLSSIGITVGYVWAPSADTVRGTSIDVAIFGRRGRGPEYYMGQT